MCDRIVFRYEGLSGLFISNQYVLSW